MTRYIGLDILRVFAIIVVICKHSNFLLPPDFRVVIDYLPDPVDLFFVLSGFLIGNIFLRTHGNQINLSKAETRLFIIRRWFRTLPLYYVFLLINIILTYWHLIPGEINKYSLTFFVFYQNFLKPYDFMFWESWSLSVEEWFYLLLPVLVFILSAFIKLNKQSFLISALILVFFSIIYRYINYDPELEPDLFIRKIVLARFDIIGVGLIGAYLYNYFHKYWKRFSIWLFVIGVCTWFTLYSSMFKGAMPTLVYFTTSGIFILFMLPLLVELKFKSNLITYMSKVSYPMYLIHLPLIHILLSDKEPVYWRIGIFLISLVILSHLAYKYIHKPFIKIRDKYFIG